MCLIHRKECQVVFHMSGITLATLYERILRTSARVIENATIENVTIENENLY